MKQVLLLFLLVMSISTFGQKKSSAGSNTNFVEMAKAELNSALSAPEGTLYKKITESGISGHFVFDISIRGKGLVATVFVVNPGEQSVSSQNRLKDIIKAYRFSFKIPKREIHKFQYIFDF
jgi:hypothetical protein